MAKTKVSFLVGLVFLICLLVVPPPSTPESPRGQPPLLGERPLSVPGSAGRSPRTTNAPATSIRVGYGPGYAAYDSANGLIYLINEASGNVSAINGSKVVNSFGVADGVRFVTYDSTHDLLVFSKNFSDNVSVFEDSSLISNATVGPSPFYSSFDSRNGFTYVASVDGADVAVLDGANLVARIVVGNSTWSYPFYTVYDPFNGFVYVTGIGTEEQVFVINGTTLIANVSIPGYPLYATTDTSNGLVYVSYNSNGNGYGYSVINGTSVITSISAGPSPGEGTFDEANGYVYIPNTMSDNITILQGRTVVTSVTVGSDPDFATYDPGNGYVYVSNSYSNTVSVISGTRVIENVTAGNRPGASIYDPANGNVYVSNTGGDNLTLIPTPVTAFLVTFTETGLKSGTNWSVTLSGRTLTSASRTISFFEPNGTGYTYAVGATPGFNASAHSGVINVSGLPVTVSVLFSPVFDLGFSELGLPIGTMWSVSLESCGPLILTGSPVFGGNSTNDTIAIWVPDGYSGCAYVRAPGVPYLAVYSGDVAFADVSGSPSFFVQIPPTGGGELIWVQFEPIAPPSIQKFYVSPWVVPLGATLSFHATVTGYGPLNFSYSDLPVVVQRWNSSSIVCRPASVGTYTVTLVVTDVFGRSVQSNATFTVTSNASTSAGGASPGVLGLPRVAGYALVTGVAAALGTTVFFIWSRRRRTSAKS